MKKNKELTELQQKFLSVLFDEAQGDVHKARELAGYSTKVAVSEIIRPLSEEIIELATRRLAVESVAAVFAMTHAMKNGAELGTANKIKAAKEILDRAGIQKKGEDQITLSPDTVVILLPDKKSQEDQDEFDEIQEENLNEEEDQEDEKG